jgi:hypothetical protein
MEPAGPPAGVSDLPEKMMRDFQSLIMLLIVPMMKWRSLGGINYAIHRF